MREVCPDRFSLGPHCPDFVDDPFRRLAAGAVVDEYRRAVHGESAGDGGTDVAGRPRDECQLVF